ncbi:MAG: nitrogenase-stabilizing/protective protein NifW [Leptolyngbya sp. SIOISBB]|nr:nitrogenase-stabilizing/protective protein NifW [Leptolyngbya sp. SIOISBB]
MNITLANFNTLTKAEEYLEFFGISYDPQVVNVNRLHILKKFSQFIRENGIDAGSLTDEATFNQTREALTSAYELFTTSNSVEQKLFKVFQEHPSNVVMVSEIEVE